MKKIATLFNILLICFGFHSLSAQSDWEIINTQDGLRSNNILMTYPENPNKVWIVSDSGLSLYQNQTITNFPPAVLGNGVNDMEVAYNSLWLATDGGLIEFDGVNFLSVNIPSIITSISVESLTKTSNGELWIGTTNEVVRYNGSTYTGFSGIRGLHVFSDSAGRVYANSSSTVIAYSTGFPTIPQLNTLQVFDNGSWSQFTNIPQNNGTYGIFQIRDIEERNGRIFLVYNDSLSELSFTNGLQNIREIRYQSQQTISSITYDGNLFYATDGQQRLFNWDNSSIYQVLLNIESRIDSGFNPGTNQWFYWQTTSSGPTFNSINNDGSKIYLSTNNGLYLSDLKLKKTENNRTSLEINNIRTKLHANYPLFSNPEGRADFEFPKDSNSFGIYSAALILVGSDPSFNHRRVINQTPFNRSYNLGPVGGGDYHLRSVHKLSRQDIQNHIANYQNPGYTAPYSITYWPANADSSLGQAMDLAPFVDVNNNGCYDPTNGDYPIIKGDEALYWIKHYLVQDMVFEYHSMLYAYNSSTTPELNNVQFLDIRVINRGSNDVGSVSAGFFMDGDLGAPIDDYVGCDSISGISYFYNGDAFDDAFQGQNGFGQNSPAMGIKILSDSMIGSVYYNIGGGLNGDPNSPDDWYNYLNGNWQNGQPIRYGGNGLNTSGTTNVPTKFMFTGDPLIPNGWTEKSTLDTGNSVNPPGDRRQVSLIQPFSLNSGASKTFSFALGYGRKSSTVNHEENIAELIQNLNTAGAFWDTLSSPNATYGQNLACSIIVGEDEISEDLKSEILVYPNPTQGFVNIRSDKEITEVQLFSLTGRLLRRINTPQNQVEISMDDYSEGIYLLKIQLEDGSWKTQKLILSR